MCLLNLWSNWVCKMVTNIRCTLSTWKISYSLTVVAIPLPDHWMSVCTFHNATGSRSHFLLWTFAWSVSTYLCFELHCFSLTRTRLNHEYSIVEGKLALRLLSQCDGSPHFRMLYYHSLQRQKRTGGYTRIQSHDVSSLHRSLICVNSIDMKSVLISSKIFETRAVHSESFVFAAYGSCNVICCWPGGQ